MTLVTSYDCVNCKGYHTTSQIDDVQYRICGSCRKKLVRGKKTFEEFEIKAQLLKLENEIKHIKEKIIEIEYRIEENELLKEQQMTPFKRLLSWFDFDVIPKELKTNDFRYRSEKRELEWKLNELKSEYNLNKAIIVRNIIPAQKRYQHEQILKQRKETNMKKQRLKSFREASSNIEYNRFNYLIRNIDYKRGNPLDNYIRNNLYNDITNAYSAKCVLCNTESDLTLDHFWLPKNEGGNFAMLHIESKTLISNVIPLCRSCNSAKSDKPIQYFFNPEELMNLNETQQLISKDFMKNRKLCEVASKWFKAKIQPLNKNKI